MNPIDLEIAKDLRITAEYLRVHGWIQGNAVDVWGRACIVGALVVALGGRPLADKAFDTAIDTLCDALGEEIVKWNDSPGRTLEEVLDGLESTALALEIRALKDSAESLAAERLEMLGVA